MKKIEFEKNTKKDLDIFVKHVNKYAAMLGLNDWDISVNLNDCVVDAHAEVELNWKNRAAYIKLGTDRYANYASEETALHEVLHVFLATLVGMGQERYINEEQMDIEEHRLIGVLTKVIGRKNEQ